MRCKDFDFCLNAIIVALAVAAAALAVLPLMAVSRQQAVIAEDTTEATRVVADTWSDYSLSKKGVAGPDGRPVKAAGSLSGWVETVEIGEAGTILRGWAADTQDKISAVMVIVFVEGKAVAQVVPAIERGDVAAHLGASGAVHSGFEVTIPGKPGSGGVRLFAVDRSQAMGELSYAPGLPLGPR